MTKLGYFIIAALLTGVGFLLISKTPFAVTVADGCKLRAINAVQGPIGVAVYNAECIRQADEINQRDTREHESDVKLKTEQLKGAVSVEETRLEQLRARRGHAQRKLADGSNTVILNGTERSAADLASALVDLDLTVQQQELAAGLARQSLEVFVATAAERSATLARERRDIHQKKVENLQALARAATGMRPDVAMAAVPRSAESEWEKLLAADMVREQAQGKAPVAASKE